MGPGEARWDRALSTPSELRRYIKPKTRIPVGDTEAPSALWGENSALAESRGGPAGLKDASRTTLGGYG